MKTTTVRVVMFEQEVARLRREAARCSVTLSDLIRLLCSHPAMPKGNRAHRKRKAKEPSGISG